MGIDALVEAAKFVEYQAMLAAASARGQQGEQGGNCCPFLMQFIDLDHPLGINTLDIFGGVANNSNNNGSGSTSLAILEDKGSVPVSGEQKVLMDSNPELEPQQVLKKIVRNRAQLQRHCEQVKCQRAYLKDCLETLRSLLPNMSKDNCDNGFLFKRRATSTSAVLKNARKEINNLKGQEKEHINEIEKLKAENEALNQKLILMNDGNTSAINNQGEEEEEVSE